MTAALQATIDQAWEDRTKITAASAPQVVEAVEQVIAELNGGRLRVAERQGVGQWRVNQWVKKAVLPGSLLAREAHGANPGARRVRLALVAGVDECVEAAERIVAYTKSL